MKKQLDDFYLVKLAPLTTLLAFIIVCPDAYNLVALQP